MGYSCRNILIPHYIISSPNFSNFQIIFEISIQFINVSSIYQEMLVKFKYFFCRPLSENLYFLQLLYMWFWRSAAGGEFRICNPIFVYCMSTIYSIKSILVLHLLIMFNFANFALSLVHFYSNLIVFKDRAAYYLVRTHRTWKINRRLCCIQTPEMSTPSGDLIFQHRYYAW